MSCFIAGYTIFAASANEGDLTLERDDSDRSHKPSSPCHLHPELADRRVYEAIQDQGKGPPVAVRCSFSLLRASWHCVHLPGSMDLLSPQNRALRQRLRLGVLVGFVALPSDETLRRPGDSVVGAGRDPDHGVQLGEDWDGEISGTPGSSVVGCQHAASLVRDQSLQRPPW